MSCISLFALQGRHYKYHCVNRLYDGDNNTFWVNQLYGAEVHARSWTCFQNLDFLNISAYVDTLSIYLNFMRDMWILIDRSNVLVLKYDYKNTDFFNLFYESKF